MRVNIYLPEELAVRVKEQNGIVNWSHVAQAAFESTLRKLRRDDFAVVMKIPRPLYLALVEIANREKRSVTNQIGRILADALETTRKQYKAA